MPVIYCNDNFGKWRSDFRSLLEHVLKDDVCGRPIAGLLAPDHEDYGTRTLILTGIAGNFCVLFTAQDACMRDFRLLVPRDCTASEDEADNRHALEHLAKVCKTDTGPSSGIDFARLRKAA